ncbi:MAG TPA: MFS transporter [Candidatus Saccharimonadales bacterium]|jgi:predicted MFS family arabinose efflux permease|nr:MFS transporter [Candidatus Saccharimonadales bacterium]
MPEKSSSSNRLVLSALVLFAINTLNFYDRTVPGALTEPIRKEFHLTDTQIGLLGSAFIWIYALVGLPLGRIADTASRKKLLAIAMFLWSSLTASAALAASFSMLLFSRIGVGIGEAACAPTATSWLGDLFPPDKRSRVLALFMLGVPVGGALSFFFSGPLAQAYGWRAAMILAAAPAMLLIPALLLLPEPKRGASEIRPVSFTRTSMWSILRIPTLWWIIASGAFLNFNMYAISTFLPAFLSRIHGLSLAASGIEAGIVYIIGGLAGCAIAGYLGDSAVRSRKGGRLRFAAMTCLVAAPFACFGVLQPAGSLLAAVISFTLAYSLLTSYYGLVYSAIQDLVAPNQRGATMAIYFLAMYACGASFGPLLTGRLSDLLAHRAARLAGSAIVAEQFRAVGLQQAMLIIPVLSVLLALVLYFGSRSMITDVAGPEAIPAPSHSLAS